jgi:hypothetical protein
MQTRDARTDILFYVNVAAIKIRVSEGGMCQICKEKNKKLRQREICICLTTRDKGEVHRKTRRDKGRDANTAHRNYRLVSLIYRVF